VFFHHTPFGKEKLSWGTPNPHQGVLSWTLPSPTAGPHKDPALQYQRHQEERSRAAGLYTATAAAITALDRDFGAFLAHQMISVQETPSVVLGHRACMLLNKLGADMRPAEQRRPGDSIIKSAESICRLVCRARSRKSCRSAGRSWDECGDGTQKLLEF